ncbi:hypothetical protein EGR_11196 [Echinococcus granulosus]|uniref:Uncharacterized protein n=1 Tax=Echinococcus granulosus TaxID=6210 RepID=W6TYW0_ECHGR|nr:hypothetical protein EGR_11196 [Echinococcus granulosus]EUB53945.1 hypothetical protein EGR_11196 [Echinococcus granulosus]
MDIKATKFLTLLHDSCVRVELFTWLNWVLHDFITHPPLFDFRFASRDSAKVDVAVGLRDRADVSPNAHVRVLSTVLYVVDLGGNVKESIFGDELRRHWVRRARGRIITEPFLEMIGIP